MLALGLSLFCVLALGLSLVGVLAFGLSSVGVLAVGLSLFCVLALGLSSFGVLAFGLFSLACSPSVFLHLACSPSVFLHVCACLRSLFVERARLGVSFSWRACLRSFCLAYLASFGVLAHVFRFSPNPGVFVDFCSTGCLDLMIDFVFFLALSCAFLSPCLLPFLD